MSKTKNWRLLNQQEAHKNIIIIIYSNFQIETQIMLEWWASISCHSKMLIGTQHTLNVCERFDVFLFWWLDTNIIFLWKPQMIIIIIVIWMIAVEAHSLAKMVSFVCILFHCCTVMSELIDSSSWVSNEIQKQCNLSGEKPPSAALWLFCVNFPEWIISWPSELWPMSQNETLDKSHLKQFLRKNYIKI